MSGSSSSRVWGHFDRTDDGKAVKCKICDKCLKYCGSSTSAMHNHLRLVHPATAKDLNTCNNIPGQTKLQTFFKSASQRRCDKTRSEEITQHIISMIVAHLLPVKCVEWEKFKALMAFVEPEYKMPCRKTIMARMHLTYESKQKQLVETLSDSNIEQVSITTDNWTSNCAESYLTMTAHYIDPQWEMKSAVLATRFMDVSHTAENLRKELESIAYEFNIQKKLLACVHDNAANIELAIHECEQISANVGCVAHTLQLSVNAGFKDSAPITKTIAAASRLVAHFKRSYKATAALTSKQQQQGIAQHKLIQSCPTRWNSTFDMFERLVEQRWAITAVLSDKNKTKVNDARVLELKDDQWILMEDMLECLKPLKSATTAVSGENAVSVSMAAPILSALVSEHLKPDNQKSKNVEQFKSVVASDIKRRYPNIFHQEGDIYRGAGAMLHATFLDPRHKHLPFLNARLQKIIRDDVSLKLDLIGPAVTAVLPTPVEKKARLEETEQNTLQQLLGASYATDEETSGHLTDELASYTLLPHIAPYENPLQWWKKHEEMFPRLARIAKSYLAIPATSVPSERMFSTAGRLVTKMRSSLSSKNVDIKLFLNKN